MEDVVADNSKRNGADDSVLLDREEKKSLESLTDVLARMESLEQKVDETNARIDRLLAVLEAQQPRKG